MLDELREVKSLVATGATAEEAAAFGAWLIASAQAAAEAAKDGGFMGFCGHNRSARASKPCLTGSARP